MNTRVLIFLSMMLLCPILAMTFNYLVSRPITAARLAGYCIGVGFLTSMGLLSFLSFSNHSTVNSLININTLNLLLSSLVLLVSFIVHRFSLRYMHGDRLYRRFFILLSGLTFTAILMVIADNLFLFWAAWSLSNLFLILLMVHKSEWVASKNSGMLAFYMLSIGSLCLLISFVILSVTYSTNSIIALAEIPNPGYFLLLSLSMSLILVGAIAQSGLFPFHRWLISSLNSPTPVSALMHAGLVNGGGILVVKFAPLLLLYPGLLSVLFVVGSISALLGTVWKLMQHDVKKMLACSTMAQMGFMMMQCGLGLFAAAIAHLCWHGLFKAYLFLSSGSAVSQKKSEALCAQVTPMMLVTALAGGLVAMLSFAFVTQKQISVYEASGFVLFFVFIAGAQLMLTWVRAHQTILSLVLGLFIALFSGLMYGTSIQLIMGLIPNISTLQSLQLSLIHWSMMVLFGAMWIVFNLGWHRSFGQSKLGCWLYVSLFNSSQPSKKTVTALRSNYNY